MEMHETQLHCTDHEFVFGDEAPFASCHASSLARTGGGFFAVWFGGTHEKHDDVAIWGARRDDAAEGWSAPRRIAKICDEAHWNPVLFAPPGSVRLHLFFKVGRSIADWVTWTMTSGDGGASWDAPRELAPGDRSGGRGPVKNKPIALADGATWLAGASRERADRWNVFIDRSEDGGVTWQATDPLPLDRNVITGDGAIQPALWESAPGRVHLLARSSCGFVCRSDSDDGGRTWAALRKTDVPNNNSGIDLARLRDGTLALAFNPVSGDWAARTPLRLALSFDNGDTWPRHGDIETGPGEFSYPSVIADDGGGVAVVYTWKRRRIAFWRGTCTTTTG